MPLRRSALLLLSQSLVLGLMAGCQHEEKPVVAAAPPAATEQDIAAVQADFQQHDPGSCVGAVTSVRTNDNLAAVTLMQSPSGKPLGIKPGDIFTFIDSKQDPQANGSVVSVQDGSLLVISYLPTTGGRAPKEGDIAVHVTTR